MAKRKLPTIGEPVFTLAVKSFSEKIKVTSGISSLNTLSYVAVNAVKCMSIGYTDDKMDCIIINKDYKDDAGKDVSIVMDAEEPTGRRKSSIDLFVDELEANAVAIDMNKQFQGECKDIFDAVGACYHEYDNVIAALKMVKK